MLPTGELTRLRNDLAGYTLPDTCVILTGTATADGFGGQSVTWGTTTTGVACRVDHRQTREAMAGGGFQTFTQTTMTVPQATAITTANRVEWSANTYNVTSVSEGSLLGIKRLIVEKI